MCDEDGNVLVREGSVGSRKKRLTGGKRQSLKEARHSKPRKALVLEPCKHDDKQFVCNKFRPRDLKIFHSNFYKYPDKIRQDSLVSTLVSTSSVKRRRPSTNRHLVT